jgi:mRNA-degrading endonuclease RelE of RelBE toxin-antitoxin system
MRIIRSPRFDKAYRNLPEEVQESFKKKIRLLVSSRFTHPSLRIKKIKSAPGIWEATIDMNHRFTFEKLDDAIRLRVIGKHDVLERP